MDKTKLFVVSETHAECLQIEKRLSGLDVQVVWMDHKSFHDFISGGVRADIHSVEFKPSHNPKTPASASLIAANPKLSTSPCMEMALKELKRRSKIKQMIKAYKKASGGWK